MARYAVWLWRAGMSAPVSSCVSLRCLEIALAYETPRPAAHCAVYAGGVLGRMCGCLGRDVQGDCDLAVACTRARWFLGRVVCDFIMVPGVARRRVDHRRIGSARRAHSGCVGQFFGTLIHHAPCSVPSLCVAVIQSAQLAALVAVSRRLAAALPRQLLAAAGAVALSAVIAPAQIEQRLALPASDRAKAFIARPACRGGAAENLSCGLGYGTVPAQRLTQSRTEGPAGRTLGPHSFSGFFVGPAAYYILPGHASFELRTTPPSIFVGSRLPFTQDHSSCA